MLSYDKAIIWINAPNDHSYKQKTIEKCMSFAILQEKYKHVLFMMPQLTL